MPVLLDWTPAEDGRHQLLVASLPLKGRHLPIAFELHPLSPWPSQNRVETHFCYRLSSWLQRLGYKPLFIADRTFARSELLQMLCAFSANFLIRLKGNVSVQQGQERFVLQERCPAVSTRTCFRGRLKGELELRFVLVQFGDEPWYLATNLPTGEARLGSILRPQDVARGRLS